MPGLLRLDAFNHVQQLEDQTDQFGSNSKGEVEIFPLLDGMRMDGITGPIAYLYEHCQPLPTPPANDHIKTAAGCKVPQAVDDGRYRFFFFPKMSFQLSL